MDKEKDIKKTDEKGEKKSKTFSKIFSKDKTIKPKKTITKTSGSMTFWATFSKYAKVIVMGVWLSIKSLFKNAKVKKTFLWLMVCVSVVAVVFGVLIYGFHKEDKATRFVAKIIPYPIAIVNQDAVTYNDFLAEKDYIHHFYEATQQQDVDLNAIDNEILTQLEENKIIASQSRINGITIKNSEVDKSFDDIVAQNGGEEKVNKVLSDLYGLDANQFKDLIRTQMLREKINNELIAKVSVRHILIKVDKGASQDKIDAAKAKIDGIKKEIDGGLDFAEAAKKYSEDVGSAEQGGKLDPFAMGEMVKEFSDTAFNTEVGHISDPVRSDFGWHIIKVEAKTGKIRMSFADWMDALKKKSFIFQFIKFNV